MLQSQLTICTLTQNSLSLITNISQYNLLVSKTVLHFILLFSVSCTPWNTLAHTHIHIQYMHPSPCLWVCALKPVNLFHQSRLWLVHPHNTSQTISPAPGCSLILYPTKSDNLSKTYLSLLYQWFFFVFFPKRWLQLSVHTQRTYLEKSEII